MSEDQKLEVKILDWLSKEGYPLEFAVANIFRQNRFAAFQGRYVRDSKSNNPREVDVVAQMDQRLRNGFLRVSYFIECKWTKEKPWIIFTDSSSRISPGACIAQSVSTKLADAILHYLTNDNRIQQLSIFRTPERPGFNGRQAFSSQSDIVYSSLQSIVSASFSEINEYQLHHTKPTDSLSFGVLIKPIIIIEGKLFESFYNSESNSVEICEQSMIRLHWKGSDAWKFHSTIDIITIDALTNYLPQLYIETKVLLDSMNSVYELIQQSITSKNVSDLEKLISKNPSHHPLIRQLVGF
jgi:hypothetical protein